MKISFHSYANKTNFHLKSFALSLAIIMRFTATRKLLFTCPLVPRWRIGPKVYSLGLNTRFKMAGFFKTVLSKNEYSTL